MKVTPWDTSPRYEWRGGEVQEVQEDEREAFLERHRGHKLERLTAVTPLVSDRPYSEPLRTCYLEATNGNERFLVKMWRQGIEEPFRYTLLKGRIVAGEVKVRLQVDAIKKQARWEKDLSVSEEKLERFLQLLQEEIERLSPDELQFSAEGESPSISYCRLDEGCVQRALMKCQGDLTPSEMDHLREFVRRNNEGRDVMTLLVERSFAVREEE